MHLHVGTLTDVAVGAKKSVIRRRVPVGQTPSIPLRYILISFLIYI